MSHYWSPIVHRLDPYIPGEQPQDQQYIKLNTNENPYPPSPHVTNVIQSFHIEQLKRYPDPESGLLTEAIAAYFGQDRDRIFIGNGSDEVLAHSFQAFFHQEQPLLFPDISYSFYPVYCGLYEIDYQTIPLRADYNIDINDYPLKNGGIIFPNPNAPTSKLLPGEHIEQLCQQHPASVIIIDEAYIDFGGTTAIPLTLKYDNLLVVQTFSKSRSLAGLRVGYAIGHPHLIDGLNRIKNSFNSYPIDSLAQAAAIAALADEDYFQQCCRRIIDNRNHLTVALNRIGFTVLPSAANFVLAQHDRKPAASIYQALKATGVLVRYFNKPRLDNQLRITVGTTQECQTLIERLETLLT